MQSTIMDELAMIPVQFSSVFEWEESQYEELFVSTKYKF